MFKNTKRQLSDGGLLFATLIEFVKCWGSGRRSRLFMESVNGEAFMNFSTFLGNPGWGHSRQNKMASGEETSGNRKSHQDPKLSKKTKRKKSQKKTERDNQRAAEFQKRKQEEISAAAATESSPVSAAAASTSTPSKEFEFSEPTCENMSSLDSSNNTNAFMNLDGNVTLSDENEVVKLSGSQSSDVEISPKDSEAGAAHQCRATTAAHIPPPNPPSWVNDYDAEEAGHTQAIMDLIRGNGFPEEEVQKLSNLIDQETEINSEEFVEVIKKLQEAVTRNRKKKKSCYQDTGEVPWYHRFQQDSQR